MRKSQQKLKRFACHHVPVTKKARPPNAKPEMAPRGGGRGKPEAARDEAGKDPAAVALGRRGGIKGGPARARKLSPQRRSQIARQAAQARWSATAPPKNADSKRK